MDGVTLEKQGKTNAHKWAFNDWKPKEADVNTLWQES